jgi:hypothetical protein
VSRWRVNRFRVSSVFWPLLRFLYSSYSIVLEVHLISQRASQSPSHPFIRLFAGKKRFPVKKRENAE